MKPSQSAPSLSEVVSRVADAILVTKPSGVVTSGNPAAEKLLGNCVGKNLHDFIGKTAADNIFHHSGARQWKGETVVQAAGNQMFDGFISVTPIQEDGIVTSIVAIIHDISREKEARDARIQSDKMTTVAELVAGTSHELNNPLAIITGYSDLLLEDKELPPEHRAKIESIRKSALRASGVVHSLLAFARKRTPQPVRSDVNGIVEIAIRFKEQELQASGVRLLTELPADLPSIFVDPPQIQQVLLHIISNAHDAILERTREPWIIIRTGTLDDTVFIEVVDNGPGIPKDEISKVFDPFFTTKPIGKGTGLGLSISYGIVREHNGEIRIRSDAGGGTHVRIEFPAYKKKT